jgi:hypothetical protein
MQLSYFLFHTKVYAQRYYENRSALLPMYTAGSIVKAIGEHSDTNKRTGTVDNYILHWPYVHYHAEKYTLGHCKA